MTEKRDEYAWLTTGSLVILAAVAIALVFHYTRAVMIPFVLAVFIVVLVSPVLDFLVIRLKFPRPLAVFVTFLIVIIIIVILCVFITQAAQMVIGTVRDYTKSFARLAEDAVPLMKSWGIDLDQKKIVGDLTNRVPALVTNTLGTVLGFVSMPLFVLIFVIFLLAGRNPYAVRSGVSKEMDVQVRRYITTKIAISTLTGVLVWAALRTIELDLAEVFGMLAFILNFIPSIGSIISTLLPIPIAAAQFESPLPVIYVIAVPGIIQLVIGNVLEPKLMGENLNLHPITILLALSFWGLLWGITGMFLAVPVTAILRIVLMQFDTFKPIANLLAGELPIFKSESES